MEYISYSFLINFLHIKMDIKTNKIFNIAVHINATLSTSAFFSAKMKNIGIYLFQFRSKLGKSLTNFK